MSLTIRHARLDDDAVLADLDYRCWSADHEVQPRRAAGTPFFRSAGEPEGVLVAEVETVLVGWVRVGLATPLASSAHVRQIHGLCVDNAIRRRGVGRALLDAACDIARSRGARRMSLRVLSTNPGARALYEAAGFSVEGVLPGEFYLAGRYVDDVLMGRPL